MSWLTPKVLARLTARWRNTWVVARRELLERIKSKWFVVITLLGPIFMVALVVVPAVISAKSTEGARIDIVDHTGVLGEPLAKKLRDEHDWVVMLVDKNTPDQTELDKIRDDKINGFLVIHERAVRFSQVLYRGDNAASQYVTSFLRTALTEVVFEARADLVKLTPEQRATMIGDIDVLAMHSTGEAEGSSGLGSFLIAYILAFVLYMVITLYGVAVMRSVVQEKTSRVMEFLVAVVRPQSLMSGKILGVGGAALIQLSVWLGIGAITLAYRAEILGVFGIDAGQSGLPPLDAFSISITLLFFVFGFFFYAAMYAAVGAMVSSEQDTQQVQMPVTMLLIIGVMCFQLVASSPRGGAASVMTMVPFWSPMLMPMRFVLGGATLGDVAISLAILLVSTIVVVRAAAKIYRVGVLLYGKRPSVRELLRWLRY
ncbi:MAG: ABC transporter permease [Kofleriaceae bacterium]